MSSLSIGIVFGGLSPEHEVSIITSLQAAAALDRSRYTPVAVYLAKDGLWYTGDELLDIKAYKDVFELLKKATRVEIVPGLNKRLQLKKISGGGLFARTPDVWKIDVMFLGLHGGSGENGGMQGLCELLDVPYTGSGVLASSLAMDKVRAKQYCESFEIPVVPSQNVREAQWADREEIWLDQLTSSLGLPLIVKPVKLGSSIGIRQVESREKLDSAIEEAFRYDEDVMIEKAIVNLRELNCSVLGDEDAAVASVLEEPVATGILTYEDKYMSGDAGEKGAASKLRTTPGGMASQERLIPAPVSEDAASRVRTLAVQIFQLLGCAGVARIDFLLDEDTGAIYFNEINTIPGSLSFYLWKPTGVDFPELVERLIQISLNRYASRTNRVRSFDVNLLAERSARGLKGSKS
ncbi:MAG: D-alanine--D-alanine ligase family protein [Rhodothermia bacterium]|nr:MAG: D-alanine--D-alanine ligase family protein [Rhodothermia bacterium]